jgi:soluble lytic murein transglycosylase-like protein
MQLSSRYLIGYLVPAALVAVLTAPSVSAREQPSGRHGVYRHHHGYRMSAYRYRHGRRRIYASAEPQYPGMPFGMPFSFGFGFGAPAAPSRGASEFGQSSAYGGMAAAQASANGVPTSLIDRVIKRESGGNARAVSRGNYGLMQIRLGTARAMGYTGSAAGLLDPSTNMTYAVRYLAGAYRAAGGNESRAVALYARGYYAQAKAQGFSPYASGAQTLPAYTTVAWNTPFASAPAVYRTRHYRRHHAV